MVTAHVLVARQSTIKLDFCDINHEHFHGDITVCDLRKKPW